MVYKTLSRLSQTTAPPTDIQRIVLIRPCCIGDVVMATGALTALRETYPDAHITWALGTWSARAVQNHPAMNAILDTGSADLPVRSISGFLRFVQQLRAGQFELAVSLVRSPLMSLAVYLSGIPYRAGLDSAGRGFGYNLPVPIDPKTSQHEGDIYLSVIQHLAGHSIHSYANLPVQASTQTVIREKLSQAGIHQPYIVAHAGGGSNPGMQMDSKRYPLDQLAEMLNQLADTLSATIILIGSQQDAELVAGVQAHLQVEPTVWLGELSFMEIGALANEALCYIGNDTGLTHLASASGAKTVMMMGPTDPKRYAPFTDNHLVLWKPINIQAGGVAHADTQSWDWVRDGFTVDEGVDQILAFLA